MALISNLRNELKIVSTSLSECVNVDVLSFRKLHLQQLRATGIQSSSEMFLNSVFAQLLDRFHLLVHVTKIKIHLELLCIKLTAV